MLTIFNYLKSFDDLRKLSTIDLSKTSVSLLSEEAEKIVSHHSDAVIFLGYLEPGWMIESKNESKLRKLIRKFQVYMVCIHLESLPFSWKNEIDTIYLENLKNGEP
jgi:hypothetical protein